MKTKIILFIFSLLFASCSHDSLPTYEDVDRIYFEYARASRQTDEVKINLGYDTPVKSDSIVSIKVMVMGHAAKKERPIRCEVVAGESSAIVGQDIEILPSVIPSDSVKGVLRIKVINSERAETSTLLARIQLMPNEYFHVDFNQTAGGSEMNGTEFNIFFDSKSEMPSIWADPEAGAILDQYFGKYSKVKFELICQVCGVSRDYFMHHPEQGERALDILNKRIPTSIAFGWIGLVNKYLKEYKDKNGEAMKDENGETITMGKNSWM